MNNKTETIIQIAEKYKRNFRKMEDFYDFSLGKIMKMSDKIRDELKTLGINLKDGKDGTSYSLE